ncbi:MAG: aminopeptidase P family protein [Armatimonadetes bacterium]|nr:aminopeptidase P family protein [Armatimonadota bacterium]
MDTDRSAFVNRERLQRRLRENRLDGLLVLGAENVAYLSGYYVPNLRLMPYRVHAVLWPAAGEPAFIVPATRIHPATHIADVRQYPRDGWVPAPVIAEAVRDRGLARARLGIDKRTCPLWHFEALSKALPDVRFDDGSDLLHEVRMVKTPAEVDLLRGAAEATQAAMVAALRQTRSGDTEADVASRMAAHLLAGGAGGVAFTVVLFGARGSLPDPEVDPTARLAPGMGIRLDIGGLYGGYYSDVARVAVLGEASERQRSVYGRLQEIQRKAIAAIRPGVAASDIYGVVERAYRAAGLEMRWGTFGHGVGLSIHERPYIMARETDALETGMVLAIEPGYAEMGVDGYHVEDVVVVTATGCEVLGEHPGVQGLLQV